MEPWTRRWVAVSIVLVLSATSCAPVLTARSAEVSHGFNVDVGAVLSGKPGDEAAWFWSFDCEQACDRSLFSPHVGVSVGGASDEGLPGVELGAGFAGPFPYAELYFQLARGSHPFGVGGRFGLPSGTWRQDQLYARYDVQHFPSSRTFLNATLFRHSGNSPSGANPGTFTAFAPGLGFESRDAWGGSWAVSIVGVFGRTHRERTVYNGGPAEVITGSKPFAVVGLSVSVD